MLSIGHERVKQRGLIRVWIVAPVIYAMIIPIAFIDLCASVYQCICFWAYKIPHVERKKYVRLLWRGSGVIKGIDRFNCMYCSYSNGVIAYVRAILIETEKYWCPIKYKARKDFTPPHPQGSYADPGDTKGLAEIVKRPGI
ncbi:MAG: hypothetical protein WA001_01210 [Patescibacteria group bacterium]